MPIKFQFSERKALEALAHVATQWPRISAFYASKVLFFAEKMHLNQYARPIVADTFIAMPNGPVPSTVYDYFKGQLQLAGDPEAIVAAIEFSRDQYARATALREPNRSILSVSDIECLDAAIAFCRGKSVGELSSLTHQERAWQDAPQNGPMDYEAMIDADNMDAVLSDAQDFAAYGVL